MVYEQHIMMKFCIKLQKNDREKPETLMLIYGNVSQVAREIRNGCELWRSSWVRWFDQIGD